LGALPGAESLPNRLKQEIRYEKNPKAMPGIGILSFHKGEKGVCYHKAVFHRCVFGANPLAREGGSVRARPFWREMSIDRFTRYFKWLHEVLTTFDDFLTTF
jgi:hypothetical protein